MLLYNDIFVTSFLQQRKRWAVLKQSDVDVVEEGMEDALLQGQVARLVYKIAIQDMPGMSEMFSVFLLILR